MRFFIVGLLGFLALSIGILASPNLDKPDEKALLDHVTNWIRPYKIPIQKWFWSLSGVTYNNPFAIPGPSANADYITCDVCVPMMPLIRDFLKAGISPETIIAVVSVACQILELAPDPSICLPTIRSYAGSLLYIIQNKPDLPDNDICGILNPGCVDISDHLKTWKIRVNNEKPLPAPIAEPPPESQKLTKILQFTDIHLDLDYKVGSNADCPLPICCRGGTPTNETNTAGKWGHYGCGLPSTALQAMYNEAATNHQDTTFIFLTGDYVHSGIWLYSVTENGRHILNVTKSLKEAFPDTEIFPLVGNHEPDVVNMYPPESTWKDGFNLTWMYEATVEPIKDIIPAAQRSLFLRFGYYTMNTKADPTLRIIVLNTNLCYINNFWLPFSAHDPTGQLQWFADTLDLAEKLHEKVFVLGHIHPGSGSCWSVWSNQFQRIIDRYSDIIKGQWYGHSHEQDYKLTFEADTGRPISVSYVGGSGVTDGMNSAFNVYWADGERNAESTWEIINHETWVLDLTPSNALPDDSPPIFRKILNAREMYKMKSLVPEEVHSFINRMVCDDDLFLEYQKVVVKGTEDTWRYQPCGNNTRCKASVLGDLFKSNSGDRSHQQKFEEYILTVDCSEVTESAGSLPFLQTQLVISLTVLALWKCIAFYY